MRSIKKSAWDNSISQAVFIFLLEYLGFGGECDFTNIADKINFPC